MDGSAFGLGADPPPPPASRPAEEAGPRILPRAPPRALSSRPRPDPRRPPGPSCFETEPSWRSVTSSTEKKRPKGSLSGTLRCVFPPPERAPRSTTEDVRRPYTQFTHIRGAFRVDPGHVGRGLSRSGHLYIEITNTRTPAHETFFFFFRTSRTNIVIWSTLSVGSGGFGLEP